MKNIKKEFLSGLKLAALIIVLGLIVVFFVMALNSFLY